MKTIFIGHFRPKPDELTSLWEKCIFSVDANVILNLYRYSPTTRTELEKALEEIKGRVFIPHQAAKEFFKNRLSVTADQAKSYTKSIKLIDDLVKTLGSKDSHPFLPEKELPKFKEYSSKLKSQLEEQQDILFKKLTKDEILEFVEKIFTGKTGRAYDDHKLEELVSEGERRYSKKIPPGYKDEDKSGEDDLYRKYGDLIVWKQTIEYAKSQNKPLIFITDDKKEDWWLEESGRTIGPRPEIIEEFFNETHQNFWMYTVDQFIQVSAKKANTKVNQEVINEIIKVSQYSKRRRSYKDSTINTSQETITANELINEGFLTVTLENPMRYATGSGKLYPKLISVPNFTVEIIDSPYDQSDMFGLSFGCGTSKDFNIHIRGKHENLEAGEYVFKYKADVEEDNFPNKDNDLPE